MAAIAFKIRTGIRVAENIVLVDLHNIPAANTIEETKAKLVELKVRITRAGNILGCRSRRSRKDDTITDPGPHNKATHSNSQGGGV